MAWGGREIPGENQGGPRGAPVDPVGEPPENDVSITPELVGEDEVGELFQGLRSTIRIQLWRKKPTWCAGFLVSIDLSPGEMLDLDGIKQDWGGGEIQFRPMINTPKGMKYCAGGRLVKLSGPPREKGMLLQADGSVALPERAGGVALPAETRARPDGSMLGLLQVLIEQGRERDRQHAELVAELRRRAPTQAASPMGSMLEQVRQFKALQTELGGFEDGEDDEPPPRRESAQDRLMTLGLSMLEKKIGTEGGPQQGPPRRKQPAAPPADAPPSAPGWRLHAVPPPAAETLPPRGARSVTKRRLSPEEVYEAFSGLSDVDRMDVVGRVSTGLNPELVQNWMRTNLPDEGDAEDEAADA